MSPEIIHIISQSSGGSHLDSRSSISGTPYGKFEGFKGGEPVENGTASVNSHSGRSSIDKDTTSPGTPSGIHQEKYQPIIDTIISIVRNEPIIQTNYKYHIAQETVTKKKYGNVSKIMSRIFAQTCLKMPGNM